MQALLCLSRPWGHRSSESATTWRLGNGGLSMWLSRWLARERHRKFGNDDMSSRVLVVPRSSVVGSPACGSLVLRCVVVESELRWSVSMQRR
jgi:hypothetical protein